VLLKTLLYFIDKDKKVLYITGENENNIQILNVIKKYTDFRDYTYIRNSYVSENASLIICNYKNAVKLKNKYNLVVYDDVNSFPEYTSYEILDLVIKCLDENGKAICFSIESIFKNIKDIIIPTRINRMPLIEPRYVITRVDLNKDIPYIIYDYLKFLISNDRKIIIYLPSKEDVYNVYSYFINFKDNLGKNIMYYIANENDEKILYNFSKIKKAILITNDYKEESINMQDTDIIVYHADNLYFDYKKLIYFCAKAGRNKYLKGEEVIFLANTESENMDKAKNIIRCFNKEAWEKGLLDI
jgi:late competence protein required for DNA uptake (superfamily II DNA/RNA helicase)